MMRLLTVVFLLVNFPPDMLAQLASPATIATASSPIALEPLLSGLSRPVAIVSSHDHTGNLYIVEQSGRVLLFDGRILLDQPFLDIRSIVSCCDNGGLLSLAFHPDYQRNGLFFVQYVDLSGDTVVARYSRSAADPLRAEPATARILLVADQPLDNVPNHHGGTLQFGPDGFLYISIGDGGASKGITNRAQEKAHFLGKLLRIDVDRGDPYAIPGDNPFVGDAGSRPEIWSYGLRNPWRYSFDRQTGELLLGDVGQDSWEEVDILSVARARGANFGWPITEGTHCFPPSVAACDASALTLPQIEYAHLLGCSVTGGYRYRGRRWAALYGLYFYGDFCSGKIFGASRQSDGRWLSSEFLQTTSAIVSFGEDDDGELYLVDYNGSIFRLTGAAHRHPRAARK